MCGRSIECRRVSVGPIGVIVERAQFATFARDRTTFAAADERSGSAWQTDGNKLDRLRDISDELRRDCRR
jgi:hypothetical protein